MSQLNKGSKSGKAFVQESTELILAPEAAGKAIRQGMFWPTMVKDADEVAKKCEAYQKNANYQKVPSSFL